MIETLEPVQNKNALSSADWHLLLGRIRRFQCTPILGPETPRGTLPERFHIAREWAAGFGYPFEDSDDLARVAQFVATTLDPLALREELLEWDKRATPPDFDAPDSAHGLLARLPVPIYITTAYDNYLVQALQANNRDARQGFCRWNRWIPEGGSAFDDPDFVATVANPVVFHLHGHCGVPESMVVTEDDYLDFLINTSRDEHAIPSQIKAAFTRTSLLFLGYRLADLGFRVLIRSMASHMRSSLVKKHISAQLIQVGKEVAEAQWAQAQEYLTKYFSGDPFNIKLYWGAPQDFLAELNERWKAFPRHET
jgi:SIR2-like domain